MNEHYSEAVPPVGLIDPHVISHEQFLEIQAVNSDGSRPRVLIRSPSECNIQGRICPRYKLVPGSAPFSRRAPVSSFAFQCRSAAAPSASRMKRNRESILHRPPIIYTDLRITRTPNERTTIRCEGFVRPRSMAPASHTLLSNSSNICRFISEFLNSCRRREFPALFVISRHRAGTNVINPAMQRQIPLLHSCRNRGV